MSNSQTNNKAVNTASMQQKLVQFYELTKPRVVALIIFTAIVGMFLAVPGWPDLWLFFWGTFGIGLASASGAAINQILDAKADTVMARTKLRPLPSGHLSSREALTFAIALAAIAMLILVTQVNVLTAVLTFLSLIGYAIVYTVYLKHATPQNIVIGGAAGAMPPVLGWVAMTNDLHAHSLLLFLIIFTWTPPHFWALALYRSKEYERAGIPMMTVTHGAEFTKLQIILYTFLLVAATLLPFATNLSGYLYLIGVCGLNAVFLFYVFKLQRHYTDQLSRKVFIFSIQYLAMLFALMLVDHYVPLIDTMIETYL